MNESLLDRFERAMRILSSDEGADATTTADESPSSAGEDAPPLSSSSTGPPPTHQQDPSRAVALLEELQQQVADQGVFSPNEPLREMSTSSLPLLAVEHYLALGWTRVPWSRRRSLSPPPSPRAASRSRENLSADFDAAATTPTATADPRSRRDCLLRACDLWCGFLRRLEGLEMLSAAEVRQLDDLEELLSRQRGEDGTSAPSADDVRGITSSPGSLGPPPAMTRDEKIARFRARQELTGQQERLQSLRERRVRLGAKEDDELDGYDGDGLARSLALTALNLAKSDALDELNAAIQELPMVTMMMQAMQQKQDSRSTDPSGRYPPRAREGGAARTGDVRARNPERAQPLQVTRVTKDALGQLQVKREEIRSGVFRPGWNQPTQSLEELAEREVRDALEREARQRTAEADALQGPRRYEQLTKDGMEDDADLVDASAALDRKWDDWKDENPRGSGNKRGNVGDRNF